MNKKFLTSALALMMAAGSLTMGACGEVEQSIDTSKTQIYVSVYNGGTGIAWIQAQAAEYNKTSPDYEIVISEEKLSQKDVLNQIDSGATGKTIPSVYFTGEVIYQELVYKDKLEDLTDLVNRKIDGENGGTLLEKIGASDDYYESVWKKVASKNGSGIYMLPYCDSFGGLVFDYDSFIEYGYLNQASANDSSVLEALTAQKITYEVAGSKIKFKSYAGDDIYFNYEEGDYILTAGKDGKYGTYDDGQPTNITEWQALINKIKGNNRKPFIWTGEYNGYVDMLSEAMMAQYAGLEEFNTYFTFDGTVTVDGTKKTVTPATGYEVYGMDAFEKSLTFMKQYFGDANYYHTSVSQNLNHTDAQGKYLLSHGTNEEAMMIVEGEWFENEARAVFATNTLVNSGRGYGEREYRFMLLPNLEGSYGLDGEGNGSVLSVLNSGAILVPKCEDKAKLAAIKDFLAYTLTDENLAKFTMTTGVANAYDYALTSEQLQSLTPFARNVFQMYHDTENVGFSRAPLLYAGQPMRFATSGGFYKHRILYADGAAQYDSLMKAFNSGVTVDKLVEGAKNYYKRSGHKGQSSAAWEDMLAEAQTSGFYN